MRLFVYGHFDRNNSEGKKMLLVESVKTVTIQKVRNSRCYGEPTLFAMLVDDTTGYAHEMEFADLAEAQRFVDAINSFNK
jgi:hypothetical protein